MTKAFALILSAVAALAPMPVLAAVWAVDYGQSRLGFEGTQSYEPFSGEFSAWTAEIVFDPSNLEDSSVIVTIDMSSADAGSIDRTEALPGTDWFDVRQFPQARFEARTFRSLGGESYEADGTLSIRDLSHEVTLPFTLAIDGGTAKAAGALTIVRTDFGVGQGSWRADDIVALDVKIVFDITATRVGE